ncbi:MAG TPA: hypothetical protein PKC76_08635 [Saprospiraceae bacterium]|nr:hypothetical protein [Saprospiraceae bacterium]HMP24184.1 hypothetical protein [Saprospiraceae bacterium]
MFFNDDFRTLMRGLIPAILSVFIGLLVYGIALNVKSRNTNNILDPNIFLNFESLNKKRSLNDQNAFLVIYFHPDCDHCHYEARAIRDSEQFVLRLLKQIKPHTAIITMTHRLKTARAADCIYLIEQGRIQLSGKHEELLQSKNTYATAWYDFR